MVGFMERRRIDLDGMALESTGPGRRVVCIFRYRTIGGLVVAQPESIDVTIAWALVEEASLDLVSGKVRIRFAPRAREVHKFLQETLEVEGEWTDRQLLRAPPK